MATRRLPSIDFKAFSLDYHDVYRVIIDFTEYLSNLLIECEHLKPTKMSTLICKDRSFHDAIIHNPKLCVR